MVFPRLSQEFFKREGKGVTLCQSDQIVMSSLPPVVGCLLKTGLQNGGHRYPRTTHSYAPAQKIYSAIRISRKLVIFSILPRTQTKSRFLHLGWTL